MKDTAMELELRKLSPKDGRDVYDLLQALPADENGFMNPASGLSYDQYRDWLRRIAARSEQVGVVDGKVPETIFWLYEDGKPVGMGKVRHLMTEALLERGGNIGYTILPSARDRGLGKKFLALLAAESEQLHAGRLLLTIQNHNLPSIRVALANGGRIERVTADRHYIWIDP